MQGRLKAALSFSLFTAGHTSRKTARSGKYGELLPGTRPFPPFRHHPRAAPETLLSSKSPKKSRRPKTPAGKRQMSLNSGSA